METETAPIIIDFLENLSDMSLTELYVNLLQINPTPPPIPPPINNPNPPHIDRLNKKFSSLEPYTDNAYIVPPQTPPKKAQPTAGTITIVILSGNFTLVCGLLHKLVYKSAPEPPVNEVNAPNVIKLLLLFVIIYMICVFMMSINII